MIYCPMCESSEVELEHGRCAVCASAVIDITDIVQEAEKRGRDAAFGHIRAFVQRLQAEGKSGGLDMLIAYLDLMTTEGEAQS